MKKIFLIIPFLFIFACQRTDDRAVTSIERGNVEATLSLVGRVESARQTVITAPYDSTVKSLHFGNGQAVLQGQVLMVLDSKDLEKQIREKKSHLDQLYADQKNISIRSNRLRRDLAMAEIGIKKQVMARTDAEKIKTEIDLRNNEYSGITNKIRDINREITVLQNQMKDNQIRSPMTGVVTSTWVPKDRFVPNTAVKLGSPLVTVSASGDLTIVIMLRESDIFRIYLGQNFKIRLSSLDSTEFNGAVQSIDEAGTLDPSSGTVRFRTTINFKAGQIPVRSGMEATALAQLGLKNNVLRVAKSAVAHKDGKDFVLVQTKDKTWLPQPVTTGLIGDSFIEILNGPAEGTPVAAVYYDSAH